MLEVSSQPLLVINGDILTQVDFRAMLDFHTKHEADMTVAVRPYEVSVPYGVIETDSLAITGIREKPSVKKLVNAGIYLLNPEMTQLVPNGRPYDMTDLISSMIEEERRVIAFPVREYWLDIGHFVDYEEARQDIKGDKFNGR
jgi:NDP-sugar pyrophosphorylase family protein